MGIVIENPLLIGKIIDDSLCFPLFFPLSGRIRATMKRFHLKGCWIMASLRERLLLTLWVVEPWRCSCPGLFMGRLDGPAVVLSGGCLVRFEGSDMKQGQVEATTGHE
jgi:hypothetical protein